MKRRTTELTVVITTRMVAFKQVKDGNLDHDWEDGAGYSQLDPRSGRARCVVLDGASQAFGAIRWVSQLVDSFVGRTADGPQRVDTNHVMEWLSRMQQVWAQNAPTSSSIYARRRLEEGSFATMLLCEIDGLRTAPSWTAAALGDTVLFHVRGGRLLTHFPSLELTGFGRRPHGVHTLPERLNKMRDRLHVTHGNLKLGDQLYIATDAVAEWILRTCEHSGPRLWRELDSLSHPEAFTRLIADRRTAGDLKNDDATLLRVNISSGGPDSLRIAQ